MNIFVTKLDYNTGEDSLRSLFAEYGEVDSAKIIMDKETGRSKGYGFVEMPDNTAAEAAISALDGSNFENRTIVVKEARPREERSNSRY